MERQGTEIKSEQGLFMKMNGLGMLVCGINAGDKPCVGIGAEFHSGDTRGRALVPMDFGGVTLYRDKPVPLCCIQRCNLCRALPILRTGPFHGSHFNGEREREINSASSPRISRAS